MLLAPLSTSAVESPSRRSITQSSSDRKKPPPRPAPQSSTVRRELAYSMVVVSKSTLVERVSQNVMSIVFRAYAFRSCIYTVAAAAAASEAVGPGANFGSAFPPIPTLKLRSIVYDEIDRSKLKSRFATLDIWALRSCPLCWFSRRPVGWLKFIGA